MPPFCMLLAPYLSIGAIFAPADNYHEARKKYDDNDKQCWLAFGYD